MVENHLTQPHTYWIFLKEESLPVDLMNTRTGCACSCRVRTHYIITLLIAFKAAWYTPVHE